MLSERDLQDYLGRYQDLKHKWKIKRENGESTDIIDDIVFEIELIKQIEINIDYILILVSKYHDTHCEDKEILITIKKAIEASTELRSKKHVIENFISGINDINTIIQEEKLKKEGTYKFLQNTFRDGEIKTQGVDIEKIMPPISRFGGGARTEKKQRVIDKLKDFFEK